MIPIMILEWLLQECICLLSLEWQLKGDRRRQFSYRIDKKIEIVLSFDIPVALQKSMFLR